MVNSFTYVFRGVSMSVRLSTICRSVIYKHGVVLCPFGNELLLFNNVLFMLSYVDKYISAYHAVYNAL